MEDISKAFEILNNSVRNVCVAFGKLGEVLNEKLSNLPDYELYELNHPKKKPRGSIRRKRRIRDRRRRGYTAKEGYEISKAIYKGMMKGFGEEET